MTLFVVDSTNTFGKTVKEAGTYNVKILSDSECRKTQKTQDDMAVLNYEVVDGTYKSGKILYDNLVWKNNDTLTSQKRFNTLLSAIGVADGTPVASIEQLVQAIKGKSLNVRVEWEQSDFNQKWNLSVKGYQKVDTEGSKPNGVKRPNDMQVAQQSFQGVDPMKEAKNNPVGSSSGFDISDDDLPF